MTHEIHDTLRRLATGLGFDLVGITSGDVLDEDLGHLEAWVKAGHHGALGYMGRNPPERADPRTLLEGVRSVVTVAVRYESRTPSFEAAGRFGRVARYAWGRDYHDVVIPRLRELARQLEEALGGPLEAKPACDHSPILERGFAARAGLGFFGKNTCLLLPRAGSYHFLAELLLDRDLPPTPRPKVDTCGTCTSCLPACPTGAFPEPFVLDARRCISYLTIEHKGAIPVELRPKLGPWVFGCDACQEACPFQRFAEGPVWPELRADAGVGPTLDLARVLAIRSDERFRKHFRDTPLLRSKRRGILRNAAVVARNLHATDAIPALRSAATEDAEALVRQHAIWALADLDPPTGGPLAARMCRTDPDPAVRAEATALLHRSP